MTEPWQKNEVWECLERHKDEDATTFLLHTPASGLSVEEARFIADQLEGRRQAREKYPEVLTASRFVFPPKLNREQSSSQATARYKAHVIETIRKSANGDTDNTPFSLADITGGMGIDDIFIAPKVDNLLHVEQDPTLSHIAKWNFTQLGLTQVNTLCENSTEWLGNSDEHFDMMFADPARRDDNGRKMVNLECCSPNLLPLLSLIFHHTDILLVKASPMIDIHIALTQLGCVREVHVLEYKGECKEVLFLCHKHKENADTNGVSEPTLHCISLDQEGQPLTLHHFSFDDETGATASYATNLGAYLYEPNAALMKAGPYRSLCQWYQVCALGRNTHLYTSDTYRQDFPGRSWRVLQPVKLAAKEIKQLLPEGRAHVVCRNYPIGATQLQQQLHLKEGGDLFIIATTLGNKKIGLLCKAL